MSIDNLAGQTLGQYALHELLGAGGMGAVYRAYQATLKREVAVKVLPSVLATQAGYSDRFNREAETAASLEHAHIVPIYDYGMQRGTAYIVMRMMTGGSLAQRLALQNDDRRPMPSLGEVSELLDQIASALDYAHSQGVIHRDIKPANIMFDNQGNAYLADFGIAKLLDATHGLTETGHSVGTPSYMAPEQWRADSVLPATDQYALGIMTYMLITSHLPFEASTPYALMNKHVNEPITPPTAWQPDLPAEIGLVLERAMAKDPGDRFPTVTAFAQAFSRVIEGNAGQATNIFKTPMRKRGLPSKAAQPLSTMRLRTPASGSSSATGGRSGGGNNAGAAFGAAFGTGAQTVRSPAPNRARGIIAIAAILIVVLIAAIVLILSRQQPPQQIAILPTITISPISNPTTQSTSLSPGISPSPPPSVVVIAVSATFIQPTTTSALNIAAIRSADTSTNTAQPPGNAVAATSTPIPSATVAPTHIVPPTITAIPPTLTPLPTHTVPPSNTPFPTDTPLPTNTNTSAPTQTPTIPPTTAPPSPSASATPTIDSTGTAAAQANTIMTQTALSLQSTQTSAANATLTPSPFTLGAVATSGSPSFQLSPIATLNPSGNVTATPNTTISALQTAITSTPIAPVTANYLWNPQIKIVDGVQMMLVPPGCFMMGLSDSTIATLAAQYKVGFSDEGPQAKVCFTQPFWIDRYPVTQEQFKRLNGQMGRSTKFSGDQRPVESISWFEARDFCLINRRARLPTEAEWEYAARGPDDLLYPWGNGFDPNKAVSPDNSGQQSARAGSKGVAGASWVGALDMSGNVWNWTSTLYAPYPYQGDDGRNNADNKTGDRVVRGGAWFGDTYNLISTFRGHDNPAHIPPFIGFRCARSA